MRAGQPPGSGFRALAFAAASKAAKATRFVPRSFKLGRPLVDLSKANALVDELEDAELAERMQRHRRGDA